MPIPMVLPRNPNPGPEKLGAAVTRACTLLAEQLLADAEPLLGHPTAELVHAAKEAVDERAGGLVVDLGRGADLLEHWNLPETLVSAVRHHRDKPDAIIDLVSSGRTLQVNDLVVVEDILPMLLQYQVDAIVITSATTSMCASRWLEWATRPD